MEKITLKVEGMHCKSCDMLVEDSLGDEAGVESVSSSFKDGQVVVTFDENTISEDKIKEVIKKEGYTVR